MSNTLYTVSVLEFCLFLSDKFMEGKKFEEVDWDAVSNRVERQNLTIGEEKRVLEYVRNQRMAMRDADIAAKKAEQAITNARNGVVLSHGLKFKAVA